MRSEQRLTADTPTATKPRRRRSADDPEGEESLVETPQSPFEDYDEFAGDNDATPDDRRRDPLRKDF